MEIDPRVVFAAERTLLAWIRTGLSMMGFGFVVARFSLFLKDYARANPEFPVTAGLSQYFGTALVALGVLITFVASFHHRRSIKRLRAGESLLGTRTLSFGEIFGFALGILGALMVAYLLKLTL